NSFKLKGLLHSLIPQHQHFLWTLAMLNKISNFHRAVENDSTYRVINRFLHKEKFKTNLITFLTFYPDVSRHNSYYDISEKWESQRKAVFQTTPFRLDQNRR